MPGMWEGWLGCGEFCNARTGSCTAALCSDVCCRGALVFEEEPVEVQQSLWAVAWCYPCQNTGSLRGGFLHHTIHLWRVLVLASLLIILPAPHSGWLTSQCCFFKNKYLSLMVIWSDTLHHAVPPTAHKSWALRRYMVATILSYLLLGNLKLDAQASSLKMLSVFWRDLMKSVFRPELLFIVSLNWYCSA